MYSRNFCGVWCHSNDRWRIALPSRGEEDLEAGGNMEMGNVIGRMTSDHKKMAVTTFLW